MKNKGNEIIDADNSTSLYKKMKAIVWTKYGPPDVLQLKEVEKPILVFSVRLKCQKKIIKER